jgi:hypothetical protein
MEGGIAILLLLIIVVVAGVLGLALYLTGGALWFSKPDTDETGDRPEHKHVDQPEPERVHLAGTAAGERAERESN